MKPLDRARAVTATGALALWMGLTNAMLKYLKSSMRPWLVLAGIGLVAMGVYSLIGERRHAQPDHTHRTGSGGTIGWLLVTPIVIVIAFGANALGTFAVSGPASGLPSYAFDIAQYAASADEHVPKLRIGDIIEGAPERANREYLFTHDVRFIGFVNHVGYAGPRSFIVTRYLISCCAADAIPLSVTINGATTVPENNQWIDITARLQPVPNSAPPQDTFFGPLMRVTKYKPIHEPDGPYESLRSV